MHLHVSTKIFVMIHLKNDARKLRNYNVACFSNDSDSSVFIQKQFWYKVAETGRILATEL